MGHRTHSGGTGRREIPRPVPHHRRSPRSTDADPDAQLEFLEPDGLKEQEVSREQWTATMQFVFMPVIPADLVIFNPMGIQVTYLETDRTLITETP